MHPQAMAFVLRIGIMSDVLLGCDPCWKLLVKLMLRGAALTHKRALEPLTNTLVIEGMLLNLNLPQSKVVSDQASVDLKMS